MASLLENVAEQAAQDRPARFPRLRTLLVTLQGYVVAATMQAYVASAVEPLRLSQGVSAWKLVVAVAANVSRVEIVPRGLARDPPDYLDAVTADGAGFYLQRVNGVYFVNGRTPLSQTSFTNALASVLST